MPIKKGNDFVIRLYKKEGSTQTEVNELKNTEGTLIHRRTKYTFKNGSTTHATQTKTWGVENVTNPSNPSSGVSYEIFDGWYTASTGGSKVTIPHLAGSVDKTYYARYRDPSYSVVWKNWDGTILKTELVVHGNAGVPPSNPTRPNYNFTGWDKAYNNVKSNLEITAQFTIKSYTVTWKDWDGTTIKTQQVDHGSHGTNPPIPTIPGYTFHQWSTHPNTVTADRTITAQYTRNVYTLTIPTITGVWNIEVKRNNVKVTESTNLYYDDVLTITALASQGYKPPTITSPVTVKGNINVANYITAGAQVPSYTVTFKTGWNNTTISTQTVYEGENATLPNVNYGAGYESDGYTGTYTNVTSNRTITINRKMSTYTMTITNYIEAGINQTYTWNINNMAIAEIMGVIPNKQHHTFEGFKVTSLTSGGWTNGSIYDYYEPLHNKTSNVILEAVFEPIKYTVTWVRDWDDSIIKVDDVPHGGNATFPSTATINYGTGYEGDGYHGSYTNVTENRTVVIFRKAASGPSYLSAPIISNVQTVPGQRFGGDFTAQIINKNDYNVRVLADPSSSGAITPNTFRRSINANSLANSVIVGSYAFVEIGTRVYVRFHHLSSDVYSTTASADVP